MIKQRADLTFKHNLKRGRYGWIRLTPAYSIKAVKKYLNSVLPDEWILDPFSGSGTTGLVCGEAGINSTLVELNPFLVWLARAKTCSYSVKDVAQAREAVAEITNAVRTASDPGAGRWRPPIRNIERWWNSDRLYTLAETFAQIRLAKMNVTPAAHNLLLVSFCRFVIEWSNAAFNHQSMSFQDTSQQPLFTFDELDEMVSSFTSLTHEIIESAESLVLVPPSVVNGDARQINKYVTAPISRVITSPPYPNRMSYIRELRPYMYWLGYLQEAREAGELDWEAIGGTWGVATSRLKDWAPSERHLTNGRLQDVVSRIADADRKHSGILATYVDRYFHDMLAHFSSLRKVVVPGAQIVYIVGNSKFYDVIVPVEAIYADIMTQAGFKNAKYEVLRKRNSKKELYEFAVVATAP